MLSNAEKNRLEGIMGSIQRLEKSSSIIFSTRESDHAGTFTLRPR